MEIEIYHHEGVSKTRKLITDIDALAIVPSFNGRMSQILGDCKTLKGQSPITRALWMKGLMALLGAEQGMIVLSKAIEGDHKLAAHDLGVSLMSEADFDKLLSSASSKVGEIKSALCLEENWNQFSTIASKYLQLKPMYEFSRRGFWNLKSPSQQLRLSLSTLISVRYELNPQKDEHLAILLDIISLFSIALSDIVFTLFNQYSLPNDKEQLSDELKVLLWGGNDNYQFMNDMRKMIIKFGGKEESDLALPEWNQFIQLIRNLLDDPRSLMGAPLLIKELSYELLTQVSIRPSLNNAKRLVKSNLLTAKYAVLITEYVCKAIKAPPEFNEIIKARLLELQNDALINQSQLS